MNNNNVSVSKIQAGIDYLEQEFMNPLVMVGEQLIDEYQMLNRVLQSQQINALIREQQSKLDTLKNDLKAICDKARVSMDDSSKVIQQNQSNIDSTLGSM